VLGCKVIMKEKSGGSGRMIEAILLEGGRKKKTCLVRGGD